MNPFYTLVLYRYALIYLPVVASFALMLWWSENLFKRNVPRLFMSVIVFFITNLMAMLFVHSLCGKLCYGSDVIPAVLTLLLWVFLCFTTLLPMYWKELQFKIGRFAYLLFLIVLASVVLTVTTKLFAIKI